MPIGLCIGKFQKSLPKKSAYVASALRDDRQAASTQKLGQSHTVSALPGARLRA
jgi:hypothetical protein